MDSVCLACRGTGVVRFVSWTQYDTVVRPPPRGAPEQIVACHCRPWPVPATQPPKFQQKD